jgi:hypothetical protein
MSESRGGITNVGGNWTECMASGLEVEDDNGVKSQLWLSEVGLAEGVL